uniref:Myb-like domain-containing protein n=1 Tax=Magallana gigas TaxID=29159 RepID=A0A8W8MLB5_MAGGI
MDDKAITGKRRSQNWQDDEEVMLIEEVKTRSGALFGLMKGSGAKGKLKVTREREWQLIADKLNSLYDTKRRTWEEVKKKYYNVKSRSKEKLDGVKRPKTGGGPPLPPLTQGEETFLRLADGEPHLSGLQGTVDPAGDHLEQGSEEQSLTDTPTISTVTSVEKVPTVQVNHGVKRKGKTDAGEGKRRRYEDLEEKNLLLDNKRLEEELHRVQEEREVLALKKEVLLLKRQKLLGEIQTLYPSFLAEL